MHEEGVEIELIDVPVAIGSESVEAAVSLARSRNGISAAGLEKGWGLAEKSVHSNLLASEFRHFKRLIEVGIDVICLVGGRPVARCCC